MSLLPPSPANNKPRARPFFQKILFKHAHGDIWNLIGSTIRPFGLTVDDEALWLRIPEIEALNRRASRVLLSRDPVAILRFLGLRVEGFWDAPFASVDALFDYVATSRLFFVHPAVSPDRGDQGDRDGNGVAGVVGGEEGRRRLKHNDRRRMKGRPVYRRWVNEFIPRLRAEGRFVGPREKDLRGTSIDEMRAAVRDEAFAAFFVEAEYNARLREWRCKRAAEEMKALVKSWIPADVADPQRRGCLTSAMLRIVMEDDRSFGIAPPPAPGCTSSFRDRDGFYDKEKVRAFVQANWQAVGEIAWERQLQRAREAMRARERSRREAEDVGGGHEYEQQSGNLEIT